MSRDDLPLAALVVVLLITGLLLGQRLPTRPPDLGTLTGSTTFRQWLWQSRSLDLAVQVGLIFVGSLGVAALLTAQQEPMVHEQEDLTTACQVPQDGQKDTL